MNWNPASSSVKMGNKAKMSFLTTAFYYHAGNPS